MVDLSKTITTAELRFTSDASASVKLGFGAIFNNRWLWGQWEDGYIDEDKHEPSIAYLELYALTAAVLTWGDLLKNCRVSVQCDNMSMVQMINQTTSSCKNCMYLIRLLVLDGLIHNRRIFARHIRTELNEMRDALSYLQFEHFRKLGPKMNKWPSRILPVIWPASKIWQI